MYIAGIDPSLNGTGVYRLKLNAQLDTIEKKYMAFTDTKKTANLDPNLIHYKKKDFKDPIEKNQFMYDNIKDFIKGCDYVYLEDYSYASKGRLFNIGEYVGGMKNMIYDMGLYQQYIEPTVVKLFATGKGNCDKIRMCDVYDDPKSLWEDRIDLTHLPVVKAPAYKSPKADITDAYFIAKFLQLELKLRYAQVELKTLDADVIKIFNRVTKANPVNILARDFIYK